MDPIWTSNGICGHGDRPPLPAIHRTGPALVLAGARCVWDDISAAVGQLLHAGFENTAKQEFACTVIGVNDIGAYFKPRMDHLVSHHEAQLEPVRRLRYPNGCHPAPVVTHTNLKRQFRPGRAKWDPADFQWHFHQGAGGTSAMLAVMVALAMGCNRVVLCGAPMDDSGHFFSPAWENCGRMFGADTQQFEWERAREHWIAGRVRSMSGRTRQWLGFPTKEWWDGK